MKDSAANIGVPCAHCGGTGRVALDPCYIDTLRALLQLTEEYNGAEIGRIMRVPETAMNNRLRKLESLGLATSRQDGRQLLWKGVKR